MSCSACAARAAQQNRVQQRSVVVEQQPVECNYTKIVIQNMFNALVCVKNKHKLDAIGLTPQQYNSYAGYLQSALNYPDNYCYYASKIEEVQINILPRIISYVPECYNQ